MNESHIQYRVWHWLCRMEHEREGIIAVLRRHTGCWKWQPDGVTRYRDNQQMDPHSLSPSLIRHEIRLMISSLSLILTRTALSIKRENVSRLKTHRHRSKGPGTKFNVHSFIPVCVCMSVSIMYFVVRYYISSSLGRDIIMWTDQKNKKEWKEEERRGRKKFFFLFCLLFKELLLLTFYNSYKKYMLRASEGKKLIHIIIIIAIMTTIVIMAIHDL